VTAPLEQAAAILDGSWPVHMHPARAAAWVTRSALEEILRDLVRAKGCESNGANTRSLLSCLEVLYQDDPQVAGRAQYAWDALSNASHHHAYELAPTVSEIADLIETVRALHGVGAR